MLSSTKMSQLWAGQEIVWENKTEESSETYTLKWIQWYWVEHFSGSHVLWWRQLFFMTCPNPCEYLSHSFFYNFGSQVISPALHAELVPALKSCKILQEKFQSGKLGNIKATTSKSVRHRVYFSIIKVEPFQNSCHLRHMNFHLNMLVWITLER